MSARLHNQVLSLAGVAQFALHAHELATAGRNDAQRMQVARHAIFCTDPVSVTDVYGSVAAIDDGITFLQQQFSGRGAGAKKADNPLVAQYMGQLLRLAGHLRQNSAAQDQLRGAIDRARLAEDDAVESILNESYQTVISPLKPKIMLRGHPSYLENPLLQARARTLLLAAVRCGFMWRQCGGGFVSLLLRRKALLAALAEMATTPAQTSDKPD